MPARIPAHVREQQINELPNIKFVRWDGEYQDVHSRALCVCNRDHEWTVSVNNVVNQGNKCPTCAVERKVSRKGLAPSVRIDQINAAGDGRHSFVSWVGEYRNSFSKAVCRCHRDGSEWIASVNNLVNHRRGCPKCASYGYNITYEGVLYALRSRCGEMVKIGISNHLHQRHKQLARCTPFPFECVESLRGDGMMIASLEKAFHGMTEPIKFAEPFPGYTEWRKWTPELVDWFNTWREMT